MSRQAQQDGHKVSRSNFKTIHVNMKRKCFKRQQSKKFKKMVYSQISFAYLQKKSNKAIFYQHITNFDKFARKFKEFQKNLIKHHGLKE